MFLAFMKGIFLGFSLVTPLGPQNIFIFNQATAQSKYRYTLPVVMVSFLCDAALIALATIGCNFLLHFPQVKPFLMLLGGLFLFYLGISTWRASCRFTMNLESALLRQILYVLFISLLNPHAIIDTFIVIGSVSANYTMIEKRAFATGCVLIDLLWFLTLSFLGFYIRKNTKILETINRISSIVMIVLAVGLMSELINLWRK